MKNLDPVKTRYICLSKVSRYVLNWFVYAVTEMDFFKDTARKVQVF
jgi:hypothetical protein